MLSSMPLLHELVGYSAILDHLYQIPCWLYYDFSDLFTRRFLHHFFPLGSKTYLDHGYKIATRNLLTLVQTDHSASSDSRIILTNVSRIRAARTGPLRLQTHFLFSSKWPQYLIHAS